LILQKIINPVQLVETVLIHKHTNGPCFPLFQMKTPLPLPGNGVLFFARSFLALFC